ncbi:MAG: YetF domain-containing protein [Rickettsiales bacterium]
MITLDKLKSHLRGKGIDNLAKVKSACIESGVQLSVMPLERGRQYGILAVKRKMQRAANKKGRHLAIPPSPLHLLTLFL